MVFDRAHFTHMTGGDAALQGEVLALFRAQARAWAAALTPANQDWRAVVHTIKGSARGIGFTALAAACERAESAAPEAVGDGLAYLRSCLAEALEAAAGAS